MASRTHRGIHPITTIDAGTRTQTHAERSNTALDELIRQAGLHRATTHRIHPSGRRPPQDSAVDQPGQPDTLLSKETIKAGAIAAAVPQVSIQVAKCIEVFVLTGLPKPLTSLPASLGS
ncbi:hypothetical protein PtA15_8A120 [Puccinia triticina]|uniref:Uncharacterized protein n=1 Tax=Puccinia triticina TaxID=208348 RepID=A0ABY7CRD1_9BASI|nr:uncharacterized protein PtA15_8A120 [Puccinia triticina]WAQ87219.1 hypothetical protein PtA15_8A120 [Puccinia triticina]